MLRSSIAGALGLMGVRMTTPMQATGERRRYGRWVANETMEDFALRFTARRARRWTAWTVANTAIGSISFLALEAIGGAITLTWGFQTAVVVILAVGVILFLTGLPISYYAARYGVDIDLLTRGAGFGYIGSTITSLIYASFTFLFFALEAAILAYALEFFFALPITLGYIFSALVVIPLVTHGISKISAFQAWTQPFWVLLHILPFLLLFLAGYGLSDWTGFEGTAPQIAPAGQTFLPTLLAFGAASGVALALIAQIGEQVDFLRFLPEPKTRADRWRWWTALIAAGPGWSVLGVAKMLVGSFLVTLAIAQGVATPDAVDPTRMYFTAYSLVIPSETLAIVLTAAFIVLSQLKINVTNAYAGSIAWSNFFSRLTHAHPGRVVWLVFNVGIALMLMELGIFHALEVILALYSHVALAWIGALVADLTINKPLGLSPPGIEFRRAHLYDINPVGIGAMGIATLGAFTANSGLFGEVAAALSSFVALVLALVAAPAIAIATRGRYYIARPAPDLPQDLLECHVCEYRFDAEDMTNCPFYERPICSLCCSLNSICHDACKSHARLDSMVDRVMRRVLPDHITVLLKSRMARFVISTSVIVGAVAAVLLIVLQNAASDRLGQILSVIFATSAVVVGVGVWVFILARESQTAAREEAERQTQRLLQEIRAHERTDRALQEAKEKAESANNAKTRYMAGLSHEIRTPLNAIYGYAQILETDPAIPKHRRNSVLAIRRSSEHLAGLIEGLLDISKIEAGRLDIHRDRIRLHEFLHQITAVFTEKAREKGVEFIVETRGALPDWVSFDEKRLRQIMLNLLANAFRYTEKGHVRLRVTYRNEVAQIEVEDTGIGIAPEDRDRIWRPFERGRGLTVRGSGLGLTITRLLVDILGGDISFDSEPGRGSTFRVRLMLPSLPGDANLPYDANSLPSQRPSRGYAGRRRTVMIVDDDLDHLSLMEALLRPIGLLTLTAPNAERAIVLLEEVVPDLFILDIDMPGASGRDLAQYLRRAEQHRATPIIIVSGHALEAHGRPNELALHDSFVAKPFSLSDMEQRIFDLLRLDPIPQEVDQNVALPPVSAGSGSVGLPEDLRKRLRALAGIGHLRGVERALDDAEADWVEDSNSQFDRNRVATIRALVTAADMPGLCTMLDEDGHLPEQTEGPVQIACSTSVRAEGGPG